ncbi:MAG TPA: hypothetical protein VGY57_11140 [Vicinamibacterales bacterium]|nr:hypothetical protein [Vicinamibacterales bacterium]
MSRRTLTSLAAVVLIALAGAAGVFAQQTPPPRSAIAEYRKGESAIKDKKWDEAIAALNAAIAIDRNDRAYRDGAIPDKYFPHHYLFIAYLEKGDLAKARENYNLRGATLPSDFTQQETPYVARLNAGPGGGATGGTGPGGSGGTPPATDRALAPYRAGVDAIKAGKWPDAIAALNNAIRADADDKPRADVPDGYFPHYYLAIANLRLNRIDEASANFEKRGTISRTIYLADEEARFPKEVDFARFSAAGDDAFGKQQLQAAVDNWNKACTALPDECNNRGLRQKLTDAMNSIARVTAANEVRQHIASAQTHVAEGDLDAAKREFKAALDREPANADATAGMKGIQTREDTYSAAKARGDQAQKANRLDDAVREFEAARAAHGQWFRRDKLDAVVASINDTRAKTQGVNTLVAEAQKAFDGGNFASAKQAAESVLARDPNNAPMKSLITRSESRILYDDGRKMAAAGDYFQADAKYKEAARKDPANDVAQKAYEKSASYLGFVSQKEYTLAKNADPMRFGKERPDQNFDVLDLIKQANAAFDNADYGSAGRLVDSAIRRDSTNKNAIGLQHRIEAVKAAARAAAVPAPVQAPTATQTTAPLLPMWMWATIAGVVFVGASSLIVVRGRAPMPVAIDALPWARVTIQPVGRFTRLAKSDGVTPFSIALPKGEYDLHVTSESMTEPYHLRIKVAPGQPNKVLVTMPAYDVEEILSGLVG